MAAGWVRAGLAPLLTLAVWMSTANAAEPRPPDCPADTALPWKVVSERRIPAENFVQGFEIHDGRWWQSSGGYGRSHLDEINPDGKPKVRARLAPGLFAEGISLRADEIWLLSWHAGTGLRVHKDTLEITGQFTYTGEGWGLAWDPERKLFLRSDGSGTLRWHRPADFRGVADLAVRRDTRRVTRLNELEIVGPAVYANIWLEDEVLRIDRNTGCVTGHLDLRDLWPAAQRPDSADVLNGIAYDAANGWLWVTGKFWGRAFALDLSAAPTTSGAP